MSATSAQTRAPAHEGTVTVAVAGNPNAGKTALFNALTGVRQKTGNWPGVTVERKEGRYSFGGRRYDVVDLPGTYSLDPLSPDQRIASDFVLSDEADVVINVLDATNLERHLYLSVQLAEMNIPLVIAVNMVDVAQRHGITIDIEALASALGCRVVPIVAITAEGIEALEAAVADAAETAQRPAFSIHYDGPIERAVDTVVASLDSSAVTSSRHTDRRWLARRLLEHDDVALARVDAATAAAARATSAALETELGESVDIVLADHRFTVANKIAASAVTRPNTTIGMLSDRVDRVVIHRVWGVPIFLAVMYLMFMFTINIGGAFTDVFDGVAGAIFVDGARALFESIGLPKWLVVVLADGLGGGIQVVATFIPVIGALYLFLSILEDSGYMSRAAFVMDRAMRTIGLPGKAFVPMIVGFGCNVPAVMATRTLEDDRERKLTIMMNPFMSCGARLPVYALFAAAFFPRSGQNIVFLLYLIGIAVAIGTGMVMKHSLLPGQSEGFLMELPAYHRPTFRSTALHAWVRLRVFVRKAGGVIVIMVMVLAVLNSLGTDGSFGNEDSKDSALSAVGRTITPAFRPMGLRDENWPAAVGIFTGVLAKEAVVGTLDSLYGDLAKQDAGVVQEKAAFELWPAISDSFGTIPTNMAAVVDTFTDPLGLRVGNVETIEAAAEEQDVNADIYGAMESRFDGGAGAFAYLLLILLYFPCVAVIGAIKREAGRQWAIFVAAWTTGVAYVTSTVFYQSATFAEHPAGSTVWITTMLGAVVFSFALLRRWAGPKGEPITAGGSSKGCH